MKDSKINLPLGRDGFLSGYIVQALSKNGSRKDYFAYLNNIASEKFGRDVSVKEFSLIIDYVVDFSAIEKEIDESWESCMNQLYKYRKGRGFAFSKIDVFISNIFECDSDRSIYKNIITIQKAVLDMAFNLGEEFSRYLTSSDIKKMSVRYSDLYSLHVKTLSKIDV